MCEGGSAPAWNLALDEALLAGDEPVLRFYDWQPPGLSLGYFQRWRSLDLAPFRAAGFQVVRRPTGGGAIAHVQELTFSVTDQAEGLFFTADVAGDYQRLHAAIRRGLADLGVDCRARDAEPLAADQGPDPWLCFHKSSPLDLVGGGRKLLGSAERRTAGRVLHHGSLPLHPNPRTPGAISVAELAGRDLPRAEVEGVLARAMEEAYGVQLVPGEATPAERARAERLVAEKYGRRDWTERR